jgi:signal transduction histidine kinase
MGAVGLRTLRGKSVEYIRRFSAAPALPVVAAWTLGVLAMVEVVLHPSRPADRLLEDLVWALCTTVPVAFARTHLLPAATVVTVMVLLTLGLGEQPTVGGLLAQTGMLYLIGARSSYRAALLFAVPYIAYAVGPSSSRAGGKLLGVGLLVLAAGALAVGGLRRSRTETASRTAANGAYTDIVRANAGRAERARIAQELHDIVAHHISLISVQAETTRLTTPNLPDEGKARLLAIGETARLALSEMRRVLGVLREDADAGTEETPQPGLSQLITLVDQTRVAGGPNARLIIRGRTRPLDPGLELTAYRIVQEALTNARKHARAAAVGIEVHYTSDALRLNIWDTGPGNGAGDDGPPTDRYGLLGMRERTATAGGTLRIGRSELGGFVVHAVLPLTGAPR